MHHPTDRIVHTTYHGLCYTNYGVLTGTKVAPWVHHMDGSDNPSHHEWKLSLFHSPLPTVNNTAVFVYFVMQHFVVHFI